MLCRNPCRDAVLHIALVLYICHAVCNDSICSEHTVCMEVLGAIQDADNNAHRHKSAYLTRCLALAAFLALGSLLLLCTAWPLIWNKLHWDKGQTKLLLHSQQ